MDTSGPLMDAIRSTSRVSCDFVLIMFCRVLKSLLPFQSFFFCITESLPQFKVYCGGSVCLFIWFTVCLLVLCSHAEHLCNRILSSLAKSFRPVFRSLTPAAWHAVGGRFIQTMKFEVDLILFKWCKYIFFLLYGWIIETTLKHIYNSIHWNII